MPKVESEKREASPSRIKFPLILVPGSGHPAFRLLFAFPHPPALTCGMPVLIRTRQALVNCKACGAKAPSLTRGVPVLPVRVPCSVCGARQVYRPSEVFFGSLPQVWKGEALR